jgi:hypothetical protein
MSRVEWTTLSGEETEAVVAMLINREHPLSVRVTPSQGDGGVDILHRNGDGKGGDVVYQVKKFNDRLSSSQKSQIYKSLTALTSDDRWRGLNITSWYLVLPLDPTPEEEKWFQELIAGKRFKGHWLGLTYVEQLAAKFPDVIDYYLHGHRERLTEKQKELVALLAPSQSLENMTAKDSIPRLQAAVSALQNDPFYSFSIQIGEGVPPLLHQREIPNLVFSAGVAPVSGSGRWAIVDVLARCAESTNQSPIELSGKFFAETGSDQAQELEHFFSYGIPFNKTKFAGKITAPGGFGGEFKDATVFMRPVDLESDDAHLRLRINSPDGSSLGEIDIDRIQFNQGNSGIHSRFREVNGVFELDITTPFSDPEARRITIPFEQTVKLSHFTNAGVGQPVTKIEPIYAFLAACHPPNQGVIGYRHIWPSSAIPANFIALLNSEEGIGSGIRRIAAWLGDLCIIQNHTGQLIKVPALDQIGDSLARYWHDFARLLSGEIITRQIGPEPFRIEVEGHKEAENNRALHIKTTLKCQIENSLIELGTAYITLKDPVILDCETLDGGQVLTLQTDNGEYALSREIPKDYLR